MATRRAIANGNWSDTATWNGGVVPTNGETVYANGFNITLDVDVNIGGANNPTVSAGSFVSGQWYEIDFVGTTTWTSIGAVSNTLGVVFLATGVGSGTGTAKARATISTASNAAAGATAGGSFVMSTVRTFTPDIRSGTTICLDVTAASGTLTLNGLLVFGGSSTNAFAVRNNSSASLDLKNSSFTGGSNTNANALQNASTGIINVTEPCIFSTITSGGSAGIALNNASTGSVTVSGNCTFTANSGFVSVLQNSAAGSIVVSGNCTFIGGNATSAFALGNLSTGSVTVSGTCTFTAGSSVAALANSSTGSLVVTNSTFAASAFTSAVSISGTSADVRLSGDFLDHWSGWKAISGSKWRLGTAPTLGQTRYALNGTTNSYFTEFGSDYGSFGNPIEANVRAGVVYGGGNLTGTCAVPAAGSVALGVPVDNTTGTAVLTPAAIRAELATELGRIDAAISSRLAPNGTLATVTNLTNAPASVTPADIWSHANRTITGGTVDTLTNAPTVPSASAIASQVRTELGTELGRIDAAISTRATPANIPSADITAIKAKTDALNTTRLAQVSTTEIVGNLLAQANS